MSTHGAEVLGDFISDSGDYGNDAWALAADVLDFLRRALHLDHENGAALRESMGLRLRCTDAVVEQFFDGRPPRREACTKIESEWESVR